MMRCKCLAGGPAELPGMPLTLAGIGQKVHLTAVDGGGGLCGRLMAMGFIPGIEMEVIQKPAAPPGPLLVRVGNCRMALGWGMAQKMRVA